jgi:hypothetical protein
MDQEVDKETKNKDEVNNRLLQLSYIENKKQYKKAKNLTNI